MLYYARGSIKENLNIEDLKSGLYQALDKLGRKKKVLAIPPDLTRFHSHAGELTQFTWEYYRKTLTDILPALGTHTPMNNIELRKMFGNVPLDLFRIHNWQKDLITLGIVPVDYMREVSEGIITSEWPAQVNKLLIEGKYDLILSLGQVVPHEVAGMAGLNKNIFIGTGGAEAINKSHFLGAVFGMERIMGRLYSPVRKVLNYASSYFTHNLPLVYVQTVVSLTREGNYRTHGLFIGDNEECFELAAKLSLQVNMQILDKPIKKVIVYLNPQEYKSFWLGNKSIYRTRMALADEGELIVLAPGICRFAEAPSLDALIKKYGYAGTPRIMEFVQQNEELQANLSVAAHLIHGSHENRFKIDYCPGCLEKQEVIKANFNCSGLETMLKKYNPQNLHEGYNTLPGGEEIYYISNPALGLWAYKKKFLVTNA